MYDGTEMLRSSRCRFPLWMMENDGGGSLGPAGVHPFLRDESMGVLLLLLHPVVVLALFRGARLVVVIRCGALVFAVWRDK